MDKLKCGRKIYTLIDGDTIMDNGCCRQLITRKIIRNFSETSPLVSKSEFRRFKELGNVSKDKDHNYNSSVSLWRYNKI